jgi:protein-tyrosine-phosphatase
MKTVLFVCVENSNRSRREDWRIPDPREISSEEFRGVRNMVESNVLALLDSLNGSC